MAELEINAVGIRPGSRVEILVDGVPLSWGEALYKTPTAHLRLDVQAGEEVTFRNASYTSVQVVPAGKGEPAKNDPLDKTAPFRTV